MTKVTDRFQKPTKLVMADVEVDPNLVLEYLVPLVEPLRTEVFKYSREWLRDQSARVGDPRNPTAKISPTVSVYSPYSGYVAEYSPNAVESGLSTQAGATRIGSAASSGMSEMNSGGSADAIPSARC